MAYYNPYKAWVVAATLIVGDDARLRRRIKCQFKRSHLSRFPARDAKSLNADLGVPMRCHRNLTHRSVLVASTILYALRSYIIAYGADSGRRHIAS